MNAVIACAVLVTALGCHVLKPRAIHVKSQQIAPELAAMNDQQVEMGREYPLLDGVGWVLGIPDKILLWDRRASNHAISEDTVYVMQDYLAQNNLAHVKVRANQYAPLQDWKRLRANKSVAWPWRYTLGALSVAGEAIIPGRVFGGDHFNPYTQTIHLYSDIPSVAVHEGGHAKDFTRRTYQGTYAAAYLFVPLWHETIASEDAFAYVHNRGDIELIKESNRILYPAYGTYIGNGVGAFAPAYSTPIYLGGVLLGHLNGRMLNREIDSQWEMTQAREVGMIDR